MVEAGGATCAGETTIWVVVAGVWLTVLGAEEVDAVFGDLQDATRGVREIRAVQNVKPKDLVDGAFLRRIPYKIEVPDPTVREGEALVRVRAAALNRGDLLQMRGLYPPPPGAWRAPCSSWRRSPCAPRAPPRAGVLARRASRAGARA